ncbi:hypothetical protein [uncultured Lamprocystis sp.]|uniref:hypothetical protein n=1 Tax=uncultured Lamprocystis sp. TaxID=543132 RepID=UPI0025F36E16|nr:hypothetical protein [uncultured Lamprocystis sp.]
MQALITFFVELCLLRRGPQDLPAAPVLFWVTLVTDLGAGLLMGLVSGLSLGLGLVQGIAELALTLGLLYAGLYFTGHLGRFIQSATALLGSGALIGFLAVLPLSMNPQGGDPSNVAALGAFLLLTLVAWSMVVTGHIIRHTFGISLGQGVALAIIFKVSAVLLIGKFLGGA